MPKFHVTTYGGAEYDVTADEAEVDEDNTNRVTFRKSNGKLVAQENNAESIRPA